jgi:cold shock CspA family protein
MNHAAVPVCRPVRQERLFTTAAWMDGMYTGYICRVVAAKGFGFIAVAGQNDCFFHCNDLSPDLVFDDSLNERRVEFDIVDSARGPRAANVRPAS